MASLPGHEVGIAQLWTSDDRTLLARLIRVGPLALAVWSGTTPGGAQFISRHDWVRERPLGHSEDSWQLDEAAFALGTGEPLPERWTSIDPGEV
jgi:hypothetical protein